MALFGLPPVDLHGPPHRAGVMGPLCGGTRGVHAAMLGHFGEAWRYNPLSVVLVAGALTVVVREALGRLGGRWLNLRVRRRPMTVLALVLLVALTVRQQAYADLLRVAPHNETHAESPHHASPHGGLPHHGLPHYGLPHRGLPHDPAFRDGDRPAQQVARRLQVGTTPVEYVQLVTQPEAGRAPPPFALRLTQPHTHEPLLLAVACNS
ncbi:hypothetical protein SSP35_01_00310 [Streptomyces sp. NBRC 110611]|uniref:DUF2752 domain-containing protein n=1 Tax=Streptomyces sp. NBRC 110611 TaxID=1621259 RepID=UPI00082C6CF0|nr:DUF2752 domain-containing protein [Streptomyces sp. NBRC 110611]GAU64695.1 hypothetical protein SSP35_01_00310 [Streptomyces sp. NBRC 110611]